MSNQSIKCNRCHKAVSREFPWPNDKPLLVRAWVECPECVNAQPDPPMPTSQEPVPIGGLWFRSNHTGTRIDVLIQVDGKWHQVAEVPGNGQGVGSEIIEPLGLRSAIEKQKPIKVHV